MDLAKVTYILITGASRGIGQTIAIEFAKKLSNGSIMVLLARSASGLETTKSKIATINASIRVKAISIDLAMACKTAMQKALNSSLEGERIDSFERALVVHNAGSPGNTAKAAKELDDLDEWINYYKLNVFSVGILNSLFMKQFESVEKVVVNITSLCGIQPFNSLTYYGSGKAAREMYFKVLASEEPGVVVLNYSPGPVDTEMVHDIQKNCRDDNLREYFSEQLEKKTILTTEQTTQKFLSILESCTFKSGDHVDYFDS